MSSDVVVGGLLFYVPPIVCFGTHYFMSFLVCNHLDEEKRASELVVLLLLSFGFLVTVNVL